MAILIRADAQGRVNVAPDLATASEYVAYVSPDGVIHLTPVPLPVMQEGVRDEGDS